MNESDDTVVETAEIRIRGSIDAVVFAEFVSHYSRRLELEGSCEMSEEDTLLIVVRGRRALVEMLATACSLGPAHSLVDDIQIDRRMDHPSVRFKSSTPDAY